MLGKGDTLYIEDKLLPIVRLNRKFNLSNNTKNLEESLLIMIQAGDKEFAIAVDELIGIQNVVVKVLVRILKI